MKKRIALIAIALILIGANFVLRYMHINKIDETIGIISDKFSENGLKFSYTDISYSGLGFWKIDAKIVEPVFLREVQGYSDKSSFESISFSSSLINRSININLSNTSKTTITDQKGEHQYISTFVDSPNLDVKLKGSFFNYNEFLKDSTLEKYFVHCVDQIHYSSSGHKASKIDIASKKENPIYSIQSFVMELQNQGAEDHNGFDVKLNLDKMKYFNSQENADYFQLLSAAGESNYMVNANLSFDFKDGVKKIALNDSIALDDVTPIYKLHIEDFKLQTEMYTFEIDGDAVIAKAQILPYFDINVSAINYKKMMDFYSKFYNSFIYKADIMRALPLQPFLDKQQEAAVNVFEKIAQKSDNNEPYKVQITKLKDQPIKFQEYSLDQVIDMYYEFMSQEKSVDEKEAPLNNGAENSDEDAAASKAVKAPAKSS